MILAIGCRFSDIHCSSWVPGYTYNIPPTKLIHVDIDPQEIGRNYPTELGIVGDAREVLKQLLELAEQRGPKRERSPWHDQVEGWKEEWSNFIEPEKASDARPDRPAPRDRGAAQGGAGGHADDHRHRQPPDLGRAVLGRLRARDRSSRPAASPGWASARAASSALKLARPDQPAVCVTSDGSFMMFPGAVATAIEYDIPAVWVIFNNYTIGVIRDLQRFYMDNREIGTSFVKHSTGEFWNPDFATMAEAMGAGGDLGRPARRPRRRVRHGADGGDAVRRRREGQPRHGRAR